MGHIPKTEVYDAWDRFTPDENRLHESYDGKELLLPELDIVGWLLFRKAMPNALHPWRHDGLYEIHYMVHGQVDWWVEESSYEFSSGQVLIVKPGEMHGASCSVMQPCEHYWLRFGFPNKSALPGLTLTETRKLGKSCAKLPRLISSGSETVKNAFSQLIAAHRNPRSHAVLLARSAFHTILAAIASGTETNLPREKTQTVSPAIRNVLRVLHDRIEEPPSVREMAKIAHMSEGTFRTLFEHETGVSPNNYSTIQRVREAKLRLQSGMNVTEVAFSLGFSSSQYFATVFKKWNGLSPSDYLKLLTEANR